VVNWFQMNRSKQTGSQVPVYLNRFPLRPLSPEELRPRLFRPELSPPPDREEAHPLLAQVARQLGVPAIPWQGAFLLTWEEPKRMQGEVRRGEKVYAFSLEAQGRAELDPARPQDREALSRLASRRLEERLARLRLRRDMQDMNVEERRIYRKEVASGPGWRFLQGAELDLLVDQKGRLVLEVDLFHRILPSLTLEAWLQKGYPLPRRARNAYGGPRRVWEVVRLGEEAPEAVLLPGGKNLLDYHRERGRLEGEAGRVVWVQDPRRRREEVPHLTGLLLPVLSLEEVHDLGEVPRLQIPPGERLEGARRTARWVAKHLNLGAPPSLEPLMDQALRLPLPSLVAAGKRRVKKPADALEVGPFRSRPAKVALLRLDGGRGWPPPLEKRLERLGLKTGTLEADLQDELALRRKLSALREADFSALLVLTPPLSWEVRNRLKALCLKEGFPTQLLNTPLREAKEEEHRLTNALLGLLVKAGFQLVALEGEYPAELVVGFDAGGQNSFRFGGAACAVGQDGSLLTWALPEAQPGERIPEEVVWDLLQEALLAFSSERRLPRKVLLLRDGRVPQGEFTRALEELRRRGVAYDLLSVRKSGGGRLYPVRGRLADGLFLPLEEETFLLLTVHREGRGTPRPLKLVREEGNTPLVALARQVYHLTRLYPPSGFLFPRLPAPLHLADRLVREVGRLGVRHLKEVPRDRLFFV